ncbi:hypothetical protein I79_008331 [Cricetulus griseus]|uniref:Uncharacterized protein n=1 Tax=Cricetulus griseus TaxID=10029 RepID=G3HCW2_CRIGR|nr:hypothetical protein I79_008331 [Cricetulus griseus]
MLLCTPHALDSQGPTRDNPTQNARLAFRRYLRQAAVTSREYNPEEPRSARFAPLGMKRPVPVLPFVRWYIPPAFLAPPEPPYLQVVLPTPPLPPTKIHLRLRCSMILLSVGSSGSTSGASSNSSASTPHPATPAAILEPAHVIKRNAPRPKQLQGK